jgi:uncharacterized protein (UPF0261 family)
VSLIDTEGQPFHDRAADQALFTALRANLDAKIDTREIDTDINDPAFALAMADTLHAHYQAWVGRPHPRRQPQR